MLLNIINQYIWALAAFTAAILYNTTCFIDKFLIEKEFPDYNFLIIMTGILSFFCGCIIFIITGHNTLNLTNGLIITINGILSILAAPLYYKALSSNDVSKLVPLFQITPVIILIFGWVFLKETITLTSFIGFLLVFFSIIGVSIEKSETKFKFSSAIFYLIICNFIWATGAILIKFVISKTSFFQILSYECWGMTIGSFLIFIFSKYTRESFFNNLKKIKKQTFAIICLNETIFISGKSIAVFAYSRGVAALVSILISTQVFIGIFFGWVISKFFHFILQEDIKKNSMLKKILAAILMFIGLGLIFK